MKTNKQIKIDQLVNLQLIVINVIDWAAAAEQQALNKIIVLT